MKMLKNFFSTIYWVGYALWIFVGELWRHGRG